MSEDNAAYRPWKPCWPDRSPQAMKADLRHFEGLLAIRPDNESLLKVVLGLREKLGLVSAAPLAGQPGEAEAQAELEKPTAKAQAGRSSLADLI